MNLSASAPPVVAAGLSEESAIVLDKWLYDVCGDEALQFSAHRKSQYPLFLEHLQRVARQKSFIGGTIAYPSRSGTREVVVLQRALEALAAAEQAAQSSVASTRRSCDQVLQVLGERTMGTGLLDSDALTSTAETASSQQPTAGATAAAVAAGEAAKRQGYTSLGSDSTASPVDGRAARRAEYEQKQKLAQRYVAEMEKKVAVTAVEQTTVEQRHAKLLGEKEQLDKEYEALKMTQELVVVRHEEAEANLAKEKAALAAETAAQEVEQRAEQSAAAPETETTTPLANPPTSVAELRRELQQIGSEWVSCDAELRREESVYQTQLRAMQQRLNDWTKVATQTRQTHHQLQRQASVLQTVLQDTAERLGVAVGEGDSQHASAASTPNATGGSSGGGGGYMEQLSRLNEAMKERSYEVLQYYLSEAPSEKVEEAAGPTASRELRSLHRPSPPPSALASMTTPPRRGPMPGAKPSASPSNSLNSVSPGGHVDVAPPHRSRYELISHLKRWEAALLAERQLILQAARVDPSSSTSGHAVALGPAKATEAFQELRRLLLHPRSNSSNGGATARSS